MTPTSLPSPDAVPPAPTAGPSRRRLLGLLGAGSAAALLAPLVVTRWDAAAAAISDAVGAGGSAAGFTAGSATATASALGGTVTRAFLAADTLHELNVTMDASAFAAAVAAYRSTGEKTWLEVDVTIDGQTYATSGIRLKGHSTLNRTAASASAQEYPWLIRLDKYVAGQNHGGVTELAIRTNNTLSSLNEAVALDLLADAGLVSQGHAYAAIRFGDSAAALRLVVEHPGDAWVDTAIAREGVLYKAEATGDYSYRGTDPVAYDNVFEAEGGGDDLAPLIAFLDFVNNASASEFADGIASRLDVQAFATYLAFEDLVDNYDAIDGPGNNSYLWWDAAAKKMTVIGWDHNLTFGVSNRPGAAQGGVARGAGAGAAGQRVGPSNAKKNALVTRFEGLAARAAEVSAASTRLRTDLYTSGTAQRSLTAWSTLLTTKAGDLVDASTVATEGNAIRAYFG